MSQLTITGGTSGTMTLSPPAIAGTTTVALPSTAGAISASPRYRWKLLTSGTSYTVPTDVGSFYVFVSGATGGASATTYPGGVGGAGYAENYYPNPVGPYSYSIGAAGTISGTAGGTTTFDTISITSSGGVTSTVASSGGVPTGGFYNASGGAGGAGLATAGGGGGGAGSRSGNGTVGTAGSGSVGGTGGGTGSGANLIGILILPFITNFGEGYGGGDGPTGAAGGPGSRMHGSINTCPTTGGFINNTYYGGGIGDSILLPATRGAGGLTTGSVGTQGNISICEVLK